MFVIKSQLKIVEVYLFFFKSINSKQINDRKNTILCPDSQCKTEINIEELKDVLDQKDKEKYYKYSLQTYVDTHAIDVKQKTYFTTHFDKKN